MGIIELILISIGLAMDAFAVSICKGIKMTSKKTWHIIVIALFFGGFQMLMPIIGWFLGSRFESYITSFDHWIAFILLLALIILLCLGVTFGGLLWIPFAGIALAAVIGFIMAMAGVKQPPKFKDVMKEKMNEEIRKNNARRKRGTR